MGIDSVLLSRIIDGSIEDEQGSISDQSNLLNRVVQLSMSWLIGVTMVFDRAGYAPWRKPENTIATLDEAWRMALCFAVVG